MPLPPNTDVTIDVKEFHALRRKAGFENVKLFIEAFEPFGPRSGYKGEHILSEPQYDKIVELFKKYKDIETDPEFEEVFESFDEKECVYVGANTIRQMKGGREDKPYPRYKVMKQRTADCLVAMLKLNDDDAKKLIPEDRKQKGVLKKTEYADETYSNITSNLPIDNIFVSRDCKSLNSEIVTEISYEEKLNIVVKSIGFQLQNDADCEFFKLNNQETYIRIRKKGLQPEDISQSSNEDDSLQLMSTDESAIPFDYAVHIFTEIKNNSSIILPLGAFMTFCKALGSYPSELVSSDQADVKKKLKDLEYEVLKELNTEK